MKMYGFSLFLTLLSASSLAQVSENKDPSKDAVQLQRYTPLPGYDGSPSAKMTRMHESGADSAAFHHSLHYYRTVYHLPVDTSSPALIRNPHGLHTPSGEFITPHKLANDPRVVIWKDHPAAENNAKSGHLDAPDHRMDSMPAIDFETIKIHPLK